MDQDIIHPPFTMCRPRYIMCLQSGSAHRLGTDISSPLRNMSAEIYHVPSEQGRPTDWGTGYISTPPSERVGQDISTPFPAGRPRYIHPPSQRVGRDISYAFRTGRPGYIICLQNG